MEISNIRIGKNIKALREAYDETQEQLGDAIGLTRQAISKYERGKSHIDDDIKILFMKHFDVTLEELMFCDFSNCREIVLDDYINNLSLRKLLPIFAPEDALKNNDFKTAYELHKVLYDLCDKMPIGLDSLHNLSELPVDLTNIFTLNQSSNYNDILQGYFKAYTHTSIAAETSANCIALFYLMKTYEKLINLLSNGTAFTNLLCSELEDIISIIDETALTNMLTTYIKEQNLDYSFEELQTISIDSLQERFNMLNSESTTDTINKMMVTLKQSSLFSNLADYYDALSLFFTDGILSQRGYDQMEKLKSYNNKYAEHYLLANPNPNK